MLLLALGLLGTTAGEHAKAACYGRVLLPPDKVSVLDVRTWHFGHPMFRKALLNRAAPRLTDDLCRRAYFDLGRLECYLRAGTCTCASACAIGEDLRPGLHPGRHLNPLTSKAISLSATVPSKQVHCLQHSPLPAKPDFIAYEGSLCFLNVPAATLDISRWQV